MKNKFILLLSVFLLLFSQITVFATEEIPTSTILVDSNPDSHSEYTSYYQTNINGDEMGVYLDATNPNKFDSSIIVYLYTEKGRNTLSIENVMKIGRYLDDVFEDTPQYMNIQFLLNPYNYRDTAADTGFMNGELWTLQGYLLNGTYLLYNHENCANRFGYAYLLDENFEFTINQKLTENELFIVQDEQIILYGMYADSEEWIEDNKQEFIKWAKEHQQRNDNIKTTIDKSHEPTVTIVEKPALQQDIISTTEVENMIQSEPEIILEEIVETKPTILEKIIWFINTYTAWVIVIIGGIIYFIYKKTHKIKF